MRAADGGVPSLSSTTTALIYVLRNMYSPEFSSLEYSATIYESQLIGTSVLTVIATDQDTKVNHKIQFMFLKKEILLLNFIILDISM